MSHGPGQLYYVCKHQIEIKRRDIFLENEVFVNETFNDLLASPFAVAKAAF